MIEQSWQTYRQIFPTVSTINEHKGRVDAQNKKIAESTSITGDDSNINYKVDFYSHLRDMGIVDPQKHYIDLWKYYNPKEGWIADKMLEVLSIL
jgi:hypothetical protein